MLPDTWSSRELVILAALVAFADEGGWHISPAEIAERTGLDPRQVRVGLWALADDAGDPFFQFRDVTTFGGPREIGTVWAPSGRARRAVGSWPTSETLVKPLA